MNRIPFFKMTGAGNDFIVVDNRSGRIDADRCRDFVRLVCRRGLSVGADGVILIENDPEVDFRWRFFNADASEAEMCGNGARCAARFASLKGIAKGPRMSFRTLAGVIGAELLGNRVKVQMPPPHGLRAGIRVEAAGRAFELDFLNTGVPHAACLVPGGRDLESAEVALWGRAIRFHREFEPAGTNVNFVHVRDRHRIAVRTYERGVEGETLACGTGAMACALMAAARELVDSPVEVTTRSGEFLATHFEVRSSGAGIEFGPVCLEGEARVAYEAELWDETTKSPEP